jgi:response regulator NasT
LDEMNQEILLITENAEDAISYRQSIEQVGYRVSLGIGFTEVAKVEVMDHAPDMIVAEIHDRCQEKLFFLAELFKRFHLPIIVFQPEPSQSCVELAVISGICVYISDGFQHHRFEHIIKLARTRFAYTESLHSELQHTKQKLEERKVVERAKGVIMRQKRLTEDKAYQIMRRSAMENNLTMAQVAQNILSVASLLK